MLRHIKEYDNNRIPKQSDLRDCTMGMYLHDLGYHRLAKGDSELTQARLDRTGQYLRIKQQFRFLGRRIAEMGFMSKGRVVEGKVEDFIRRLGATALHMDLPTVRVIQSLLPRVYDLYEKAYNNDTWLSVPWENTHWWQASPFRYLHALHMSEKNPGNVAYAQTVEKGLKEQFVSAKAGRYLTRFFSDVLDEDSIRKWAEKCAVYALDMELEFIESNDPDGWVCVYREGPDSCMKGYDCVRIYAHDKSVLRLAYLTQGDNIVGRCIVREDTDPKQYVRVYPNTDEATNQMCHTKLRTLLEEKGYVHGSLIGVLLDAVEDKDGDYYMPYLDHGKGNRPTVSFTTVNGKQYFIVDKNGDFDASTTNGTICANRVTCDNCGDRYDEDEMTYIESEGDICNGCLENGFVYAQDTRRNEGWVRRDDAIYCESNGQYYTQGGAQYHNIVQCVETEYWYELDELVCTSRGYMQERFTVQLDVADADGNEYAHRDDVVQTHDGRTILKDESETRTVTKVCHVDDEDETEE